MSTVYDVAVVGSRGFLGSAVAAALEDRGAHVGRFTKEQPYVADGELVAPAPTVVWAVGHVTPADPSRGAQSLVELQAFVDAAKAVDTAPHVILLSSGGAVYGSPAVAPFSETDQTAPANEYGRVKLDEEWLVSRAGVPHTVLRIANPYGPAQARRAARAGGNQGVVGHWLAAIRDGHPVTIYGDGSAVRDYVYVDDAAAAIATTAERKPGGVINVGSGVGTSLAELLTVVHSAVAPHAVEVRREPARGMDPAAAWLEVKRARKVLGWTATTSLAEGIARTWAAVSE